jgi:hypothetical protein
MIEIQSDTELTDLVLKAEDTYQGIKFDLSTGEQSKYEYSDSWDATSVQKYSKSTGDYKPYTYAENRHRLLLAPQEKPTLTLHFQLNDTEYDVALSSKLTELKANHIYIIKINKSGECTLNINDWQEGGNQLITD